MLQHRKELDSYISERGEMSLPDDFTLDIPPIGLKWFLKYGVSSQIARHYNFGWSEKMQRVVMPVYDEAGNLRTTQSRAVYANQKPKYMNKKAGDMSAVAFHSDDLLFCVDDPIRGLVITEDILSCVRVGRLIPSLSTLGTHLSDKVAVGALRGHRGPIFIWYDGDDAGRNGARKAKKTLDLLGIDNRIVKTELDPKEYNNEEIEEILEGCL